MWARLTSAFETALEEEVEDDQPKEEGRKADSYHVIVDFTFSNHHGYLHPGTA
jgi:hypothetical protein